MGHKNGIDKVRKYLHKFGLDTQYVDYELYYHTDSFHKGELYILEVYRTGNGYYIKCKTRGKPRYYLCEEKDGLASRKVIAFSQQQFIDLSRQYLLPELHKQLKGEQ